MYICHISYILYFQHFFHYIQHELIYTGKNSGCRVEQQKIKRIIVCVLAGKDQLVQYYQALVGEGGGLDGERIKIWFWGGVYWGDFPGGGMSEFSAGGGSSPHSLPVGKTLLFGHFFCDLSKKKLFLCMLLRQFMLTPICIKNADITIFLCIIYNSRAEECLHMKTIFLILSSIDVTLS